MAHGENAEKGGRRGKDNWRGHTITRASDGTWTYADGTFVKDDPERTCGHCGVPSAEDGHDPCIADLPGVTNACCGHGTRAGSYVQFADGRVLRGFVLDPDEPRTGGSDG